MTELELMLRDAARVVEWPSTPDMPGAVAGRLDHVERVPRPAPHRFRLRRPLALALAALLVLAAGAAAIPGVRDPVLELFGLRSVRVERVPRLPFAPHPGDRLALGARASIAAARRRLGFEPVVPAALANPAVYADFIPPGGQLGLVYRGGRLLLTEIKGDLQFQYLRKFLPPTTKITPVDIGGERGIWLHGGRHEFAYQDADGQIRTDSARLAGDTLLWRHGRLLLRLEGARSEAEALTIARSVRAAP
jgi:hypothetical protein